MTTEEKAKAYDEALKRAKEWINEREQLICPREIVESIFSELSESEDERMIRVIGLALTDVPEERFTSLGTTLKDCLAYLEKQKEQKHPNGCFTCDEYKKGYEEGRRNGFTAGYNKAMKEVEQKEQKSISAEEALTRAGLKPYKDGNQWCIFVGDNIQEGICGFGDTIDEALYQFLTEVLEMQKGQRPVKCIKFDDEFENQVSHLIASIFNGEHEYSEGFVKHVAQSLLGFAKKEQKPIVSLDTMLSKDPHLPKQAVKYGQKLTEWSYDNRVQYDNVKSGIEAFASTYSFNIESKLFPQLTKEQQQLWREEIEQAVIAGGESGIELARDNRYKENKTAEWSEEDEKMLDAVIDIVSNSFYEPLCPREGMLAWLKFLRPQPKVEWNEEDDKLLCTIENCICQCVNTIGTVTKTKCLDLLKLLRSLPSWKPTEEQMEAFRGYIEDFQARAEAAVGGWNNFDVMIRLYEQLKKL